MFVNADISYCNKAGVLPICTSCKRNLDLYEDADNFPELWWLSASIQENDCKLFWDVKREE
jgi:hypothetical protein